jgi:hypothetical protein
MKNISVGLILLFLFNYSLLFSQNYNSVGITWKNDYGLTTTYSNRGSVSKEVVIAHNIDISLGYSKVYNVDNGQYTEDVGKFLVPYCMSISILFGNDNEKIQGLLGIGAEGMLLPYENRYSKTYDGFYVNTKLLNIVGTIGIIIPIEKRLSFRTLFRPSIIRQSTIELGLFYTFF